MGFSGCDLKRCDAAFLNGGTPALSCQRVPMVEAFNVFNHGQFFGANAVNGNISSANFGQIQTASPPRLMQVAARFTF